MERSGTLSTMSAQEEPLKPLAKPRPEIPPKPSPQPDPSPPAGDAVAVQSVSGGKVKSIVSKFSRQDSVSHESEDGAVNGSPEATKIKRLKRPPTIKPKPKSGRASLPTRLVGQAPPLPMKRSRRPKVVVPADRGNHANVEGSRSGRVIIKSWQLASSVLQLITAVGEGAGVPGSQGLKSQSEATRCTRRQRFQPCFLLCVWVPHPELSLATSYTPICQILTSRSISTIPGD